MVDQTRGSIHFLDKLWVEGGGWGNWDCEGKKVGAVWVIVVPDWRPGRGGEGSNLEMQAVVTCFE